MRPPRKSLVTRILVDRAIALYGVTTKRLNEQVKRNAGRFPADFAFRLTAAEAAALRSQFATPKTSRGSARGGRRSLPLTRKLDELERKYRGHDEAIAAILSTLREFARHPAPKRRGIGFTADFGP